MEPRFVLLKGTVYPVLGKFETLILRHKDLEVCTFIIVQTSNGINTLNQNLSPQLLGPSDVFPLTLKGVKKSFSLDDDYYPPRPIISRAINIALEEISFHMSVSLIKQFIIDKKRKLKWKEFEHLRKFFRDDHRTFIDLVEK